MSEPEAFDTLERELESIPLFPLGLVLYPGSQLELRIFEPRYHSLIESCIGSDSGFGVVRIEEGVDALREPDARQPTISSVGSYVRIIDHVPLSSGQRLVRVAAGRRFEVLVTHERADRLLMGRVSWLQDEAVDTIPSEFGGLVDMLRDFVTRHPELEDAINLDDASQLSWWLARLRVRDSDLGQQILSLNNPLERLRTIEQIISMEGAS